MRRDRKRRIMSKAMDNMPCCLRIRDFGCCLAMTSRPSDTDKSKTELKSLEERSLNRGTQRKGDDYSVIGWWDGYG
jgi:hypothetical protein